MRDPENDAYAELGGRPAAGDGRRAGPPQRSPAHLPDRTREVGRRGVSAAREALAAATSSPILGRATAVKTPDRHAHTPAKPPDQAAGFRGSHELELER